MPHLLSASRANASIYPENVLYLGVKNPGASLREAPEAQLVDRWRARAEARREECLARYDLLLISGRDVSAAAEEVLFEFLSWTRTSASAFGMNEPDDVLDAVRSQEMALWDLLAQTAAQGAAKDPGTVDRFLRVWLTVVHEAIRTGNAPLYAVA